MTTKNNTFDAAIAKLERRLEAGVLHWVRNDQIFNGFRNTPARVLLALFTNVALYGFPVATLFVSEIPLWGYGVALLLCLFAQKLSLRFVFDDDDVIDEYQHNRRNQSYRRAYKRIGSILVATALLMLLGIYYQEKLMGSGWQWEIDTYKASFGLVFVVGLFILQKYLSWGWRGEPLESAK